MTADASSKISKELWKNLQQKQNKIALSPADIKAKEASFEQFKAARVWLEEKFPNSFNFKEPKPLKLGIQRDLLSVSSPFSKSLLRKCLGVHMNSIAYLKATIQADWRYNLNGEKVEEVTQEQKDHALQQLQHKKKLWKNNKKARRSRFSEKRKETKKY
jgi:sRNA-binding protein